MINLKYMCRVIVTGASGFVGQHLVRSLELQGRKVVKVDRTHGYNILDTETISRLVRETQPEAIYHLAGFSSIGRSWDNPAACFLINVEGTKNLLTAVREAHAKCPVIFASSSEVYGQSTSIPTAEDAILQPMNPYGESRVRQEGLIQEYSDVNWIIARSYSHIGPGQGLTYAFPGYAARLLDVKEGKHGNIIQARHIDEWRDISDVRDVVNIYQQLEKKAKAHTIVNVCSGHSILMRQVIQEMADIVGVEVELHAVNESGQPPRVHYQAGSVEKLQQIIGEVKRTDLAETLGDVIRYVRHERT